jgi:hypothetical protein
MDYIPLSSFDSLPSPHDIQPTRRDPWFVWAIAASPVVPLAVILLLGTSAGLAANLMAVLALVGTSLACVYLAKRDQRAIAAVGATHPVSPRLAWVPGAYLLIRASHRAAEPHRGNPLHPVVLHFFAGFALGYYLALVLMSVLAVVNKGGFS